MSSILNIGQSALAAAQAGLTTTGHNIANASTPGYSRQIVSQAAAAAQKIGAGYQGGGAVVSGISRAFDALATSQVRSAQTIQSAGAVVLSNTVKIETALGDNKVGLSPSLNSFFSGLQTLTSDPLSASARQAVLSNGAELSSQFQSLAGQLSMVRSELNTQLGSSVDAINSSARQISSLNDTISREVAAGESPNDLLDQRDQLILDISKQVQVSVVDDGKSGYNVFIGNGQPLVVGVKTYQLEARPSGTQAGRVDLAYRGDTQSFAIPDGSVSGGVLGGLLEFRSKTLDPVQNSLGRIAITFADSFNRQNGMGLDQDGNFGGAIFSVGRPAITASSKNSGAANATADIVDSKALTTSDYRLSYDGSAYAVTRLSDGTKTVFDSVPAVVDGVSFGVQSPGAAAGDSYLVQPTANGAAEFRVVAASTRSLATAAPVVGAGASANKGSGIISSPSTASNYSLAPLTAAVTLTVSGAQGSQQISGFPDGSSIPYISGSKISFGGMSFEVSGVVADGDQFKLKPNVAEARDSRNAIALVAQQKVALVDGSSVGAAYAQVVSGVGNRVKEVQSLDAANVRILAGSVESQQSISGVNLDEEAANLMKYQQAYQAAGKVMQAANAMFDVLISLGR